MEVFFFLEPLQEQFVMAGVEVPVEVAEVVAGRVVAVVGELDPAAELLGPPLGHQAPPEDPARDQREIFDLFEEVRAEQGHEPVLL